MDFNMDFFYLERFLNIEERQKHYIIHFKPFNTNILFHDIKIMFILK